MKESVSARVEASPETVFKFVTNVSRLPEWNVAITEVVETPALLGVGSVWKVRIHALGQTWVSKSQVSVIDPLTGRFAYRSQSDDGNPSYADWEWHISGDGAGSIVTVAADLNPITFWRKRLLLRIRRGGLRKEMRASLVALDDIVHA
ncbi:MAG: SRPBCC family protein [Ilumatobacteraceae bacterium]